MTQAPAAGTNRSLIRVNDIVYNGVVAYRVRSVNPAALLLARITGEAKEPRWDTHKLLTNSRTDFEYRAPGFTDTGWHWNGHGELSWI